MIRYLEQMFAHFAFSSPSNIGSIGGTYAKPVILPPQVHHLYAIKVILLITISFINVRISGCHWRFRQDDDSAKVILEDQILDGYFLSPGTLTLETCVRPRS